MAITLDKTILPPLTKPDLSPDDEVVTLVEGTTDTITNIQCTIEDEPNINIEISLANLTVTFSGTYIDPYRDYFYLVDKGKGFFDEEENRNLYAGGEDIMEDPIVYQGITGIPEGKDLYRVDQDTTPLYTKTYTVTVTYTRYTAADKLVVDLAGIEVQFEVTQDVLNNPDSIRIFMQEYLRRNA